jgi:hypothetical protein
VRRSASCIRIAQSGGLAWYLDQVLAALRTHGPFKGVASPPGLGHVVVACHSGGGVPMRLISATPQPYLDKVREFWGFDCLYNGGDADHWTNWGRANPGKKLFVYYASSTASQSRALQTRTSGLANVHVEASSTETHNRVPITYWQSRLNAARFFLAR